MRSKDSFPVYPFSIAGPVPRRGRLSLLRMVVSRFRGLCRETAQRTGRRPVRYSSSSSCTRKAWAALVTSSAIFPDMGE